MLRCHNRNLLVSNMMGATNILGTTFCACPSGEHEPNDGLSGVDVVLFRFLCYVHSCYVCHCVSPTIYGFRLPFPYMIFETPS
jgi:hypothetical protein